MKIRWRLILPTCGLIWFSVLTSESVIHRNLFTAGGRYFWWCSIRLDSDPLSKHNKPPAGGLCVATEDNCFPDDPIGLLVEQSVAERLLLLSAFPALLVGAAITYVLDRVGVSEVVTFMTAMPLLIGAWFYFVGWILERWRDRRSARRHHN